MGGMTIVPDCLIDDIVVNDTSMLLLPGADKNLITASSTGALLWSKQIIEHLDVFRPDTLASWYDYFSSGDPKHFFALMQTLTLGTD